MAKGEKVRAIISAAGVGSRMGEISRQIPKCLIKINDKPILLKQIETLQKNGITDISVVVGYKKENVIEACKGYNIKFYENADFNTTGALQSLFCAQNEFNDDVLLIYGDTYFEPEFIETILSDNHSIAMAIDKSKKDEFAQEEVEIGGSTQKGSTKVSIENGLITNIAKKMDLLHIAGTFANVAKIQKPAVLKIKDKINSLIKSGEIKQYPGISNLFSALIKEGQEIYPIFINPHSYAEVDYPKDLDDAKKMFERRIQAVLFDAEDVLYIRDSDTLKPLIDLFATEKGIKVSGRQIVKANNTYKLDSFKGIISKDDNLRKTLELLNIPYDDEFFQKFKDIFIPTYSFLKATESAADVLKELKNRGVKIAVITDSYASGEKKWNMFKSIGLDSYIDIIVSSTDTGYTKDHKEPYLKAVEKLNLSPDQAIFVGHQQYEMDGAKKAGVTSISIDAEAKGDYLVNDLKNILPIVLS